MDPDKIFEEWKAGKRDHSPREGFSRSVMDKIRKKAPPAAAGNWIEEVILRSRLKTAALAAAATVFGVFRVSYIVAGILKP